MYWIILFMCMFILALLFYLHVKTKSRILGIFCGVILLCVGAFIFLYGITYETGVNSYVSNYENLTVTEEKIYSNTKENAIVNDSLGLIFIILSLFMLFENMMRLI